MILNNVEVKILASIELIDVYNKKFPKDLITKNVIYCVHNKINGKNYVGQTINFRNRFSMNIIGHFKCYNDYINGNPIRGKYLYRAWNKYEFKSFIVYIIDEGSDRADLDIVFGNSSNEIKERYLELYKKKRDQNIEKFRTKDWGNQTSAIQTLKSINNILNEFSITSWEEYKLAVYEKCGKRYRYKVKPRLKKLIEILPVMKTLKDWTLNHERIFGQLTEKNIENL